MYYYAQPCIIIIGVMVFCVFWAGNAESSLQRGQRDMNEVFILSGQRTAIGDYGKGLKDVPPTKLGEIAIRAALGKSGIEAAQVQQVVMGNVIHTEPRDAYLARVAAV